MIDDVELDNFFEGIQATARAITRVQEAVPMVFVMTDMPAAKAGAALAPYGFAKSYERARAGITEVDTVILGMPFFWPPIAILEVMATVGSPVIRKVMGVLRSSLASHVDGPEVALRTVFKVLKRDFGWDEGDFSVYLTRRLADAVRAKAVAQVMEGWLSEGTDEERASMRARYGPRIENWPTRIRSLNAYLETPEWHRYTSTQIVSADPSDPDSPALAFTRARDSGRVPKKSEQGAMMMGGRFLHLLEQITPPWERASRVVS